MTNAQRSTTKRRRARPPPASYNEPLAAGPDGRSSQDGRKVRTPQSSVPDNVREAGFKPGLRLVPQKTYRPGVLASLCRRGRPRPCHPRIDENAGVRVKRCGKSAPPPQQCDGQGKPHTEQDQIGRDPVEVKASPERAGSVRHNLRVGRLRRAVMRAPEE